MGKVVKLESKSATAPGVRTRLQSGPAYGKDSPLTPELKAFIDRAIVPILVKSYVEKLQDEKPVAHSVKNASSCTPMPSAPQAEAAQ